MTAEELISDLRMLQDQPHNVILVYIADRIHLLSGMRDVSDVIALLKQAGEGLKPPTRFSLDFCPRCGHIHCDDAECGCPMGGGRICRCERAVSA